MCLPAPATDEVEINVLKNPNKVDEEEIETEKNRDIPCQYMESLPEPTEQEYHGWKFYIIVLTLTRKHIEFYW